MKLKDNKIVLLAEVFENDLAITNTPFHQRHNLKISWKHTRSKHWQLVDYVVLRRKDSRDARMKMAVPLCDDSRWTDRRLIARVAALKPAQKCFRRESSAAKLGETSGVPWALLLSVS